MHEIHRLAGEVISALAPNATAIYKGRMYRLLYLGPTKYGQRARLQFLDGSKDFWVAADQVKPQASSSSSSRTRTPPRRGPNRRYECDECGEMVTPGTRCWETGLTH